MGKGGGVNVNFDISLGEEQTMVSKEILKHPYTFVRGMAGSGKTLLAVYVALDLLFKKEIDRIVIARPTVSSEDNGFIPGTIAEKMDPWMVPIRDNMRKVYNHPEKLTKLENEHVIINIPFTHFRGRTFERSVCIIDEFQNLTSSQLMNALGRLGRESKMIFCGDDLQIDLRCPSISAIHDIRYLVDSPYVYDVMLEGNYRHDAVVDVLKRLSQK